jgi:SAM-dependent methyltransferase
MVGDPFVGVQLDWVQPLEDWELLWAPYDPAIYRAVLAEIRPEDIVLEIGAGDLRLARRIAKIARRVEAIEIQAELLEKARQNAPGFLEDNLVIHQGDARFLPFPQGTTVAVLLMRHCTHFDLYSQKLKQIGCERLITNARWRMSVEVVQIFAPRVPYSEIGLGWYACACGAVGFKPGPVDQIGPEIDENIHEVLDCPNCYFISGVSV